MILSFDAAHTLMDVRWHPGGFAFECATLFGLDLDPQIAVETYDRLVMGTRREYEVLNLKGDRDACVRYWDDLAERWLAGMGQDPQLGSDLSRFARNKMYGDDSPCFVAYPETHEVLSNLKAQGYRMIVLSNWDYSLDRTLEALGLREFFEHTIASLEHGVEKPEVELFRIVEGVLGATPDEFIHFGDNPIDDLEGARNAGWGAVLVDRQTKAPSRPRIPDLTFVPEAIQWHA